MLSRLFSRFLSPTFNKQPYIANPRLTKLLLSELHGSSLYSHYIDSVIPKREIEQLNKIHEGSDVYADSHGYEICDLIKNTSLSEDDVFVDLGSGLGKVCCQIAIETNIKKVIGVELSKTRLQKAKKVAKKLRRMGLRSPEIEFVCDNILNGETWKEATVVYCWAQCIPGLLPEIARLARKNCENLRYIVLNSAKFDERDCIENKLKLVKSDDLYYYYIPY